MTSDRLYFPWIDTAKGIGIILVVIGHCLFPCHGLIDVFHIPLFFFLAGLTFKPTSIFTPFIISKINRIAIPFIFWTIASACIALIPHPYEGPFNGPLWFLQCIFAALIISYLAFKANHKTIVLSLIVITAALIYLTCSLKLISDFLPFKLLRALTAYIYIVTGYFAKDIVLEQGRTKSNWLIWILSLTVFLCLFAILYRQGFNGAFFNLSMFDRNPGTVFLCSVSGILATVYFSKIASANSALQYLGKNSLVIMCVHFPFAQLCNVYISKTTFYTTLHGKIVFGLIEYTVVMAISVMFCYLCKKYIPRLTGYQKLVTD